MLPQSRLSIAVDINAECWLIAGWGPEPDMWAVGCVIYWLLCGYTPFRASTIPKVLWNIEKGR